MITGKSIITEKGASLEAAAIASGVPVVLTHFVVGDGGGGSVVPLPSQTQLVNEVYRGAITRLFVTPEQRNQIVAHLKLPSDIGGFVVREVGLLTAQGDLYAVSSCPAIEKPDNGVIIQLQFRLAVSSTEHIDLTVLNGDGVFLRQDANLIDVIDKQKAIGNLGLKITVEKAANAVQRDGDTMTGKLNLPETSAFGVNTPNELGGDSIAIGDSTTGFKQNGDGVLDVYTNGQHVFRFVVGIINSLRSLRTDGYIAATGGVYEANGNDNVRVYSPNNPPPDPDLSAYATRDWVLQNTVQNIDHTAPIEVQFWDGKGYPRGTDGAAMYNFSMVGGMSNVGWIHFRYTRKLVNGNWYIIA
jgi:hypothetical protein